MSRARPWIDPMGREHWFDRLAKATSGQLQLLADAEGIDVDDLLDEGLGQRQVLERLHALEGAIPPSVFAVRAARTAAMASQGVCAICPPGACEGMITRHHVTPRWMMLLLENYQSYAARSRCCIPVCLSRHRDLHIRGDEAPKSIVPYLSDWQRAFAQRMLDEFREQRPVVWDLICQGDESTYEGQLAKDYLAGKFREPARLENQRARRESA